MYSQQTKPLQLYHNVTFNIFEQFFFNSTKTQQPATHLNIYKF